MEKQIRKVIKSVKGRRATDGAGVSLVRVLSDETVSAFDPILLLDSFDSTDPKYFDAGFPTHPHRGIETVTFVAEGSIRHKDNLGNEESVSDGEAQWLTAGSGAFHSEYLTAEDRLLGVQLWLNLPKKDKMCPPAYHSITNDMIQVFPFEGGKLRLITGEYQGHQGYLGKYLPLDYYDIILDANASFTVDTLPDRSVMAFMLQGMAELGGEKVEDKTAVKLGHGDIVTMKTGKSGAEVLLISSRKLNEPVAWYGPIVMNTTEEIDNAIEELERGTFLKSNMDYSEK